MQVCGEEGVVGKEAGLRGGLFACGWDELGLVVVC